MFNVSSFFSGWIKWLINNPEAGRVALIRAEHCKDCNYSVKRKYLDWVGDEIKEIEGFKCDVCDCPLSALLRATDSECEHPDGSKWGKI